MFTFRTSSVNCHVGSLDTDDEIIYIIIIIECMKKEQAPTTLKELQKIKDLKVTLFNALHKASSFSSYERPNALDMLMTMTE